MKRTPPFCCKTMEYSENIYFVHFGFQNPGYSKDEDHTLHRVALNCRSVKSLNYWILNSKRVQCAFICSVFVPFSTNVPNVGFALLLSKYLYIWERAVCLFAIYLTISSALMLSLKCNFPLIQQNVRTLANIQAPFTRINQLIIEPFISQIVAKNKFPFLCVPVYCSFPYNSITNYQNTLYVQANFAQYPSGEILALRLINCEAMWLQCKYSIQRSMCQMFNLFGYLSSKNWTFS